ncbi:hypothetical protein SAMN05216360_10258 [Methylobacterium phyllostachyos]|uniref:Uncharacterized protein n=1 Tax=Methylobacterium phyllostachyos TaxID=582672 RepID=A0A1G9T4J5_9HYPH|nr:hypothetical protein SAMN05216360_10258 [Methylobacterium phyllostachyos]
MASGYVVSAVLEAAGLIGLVIALIKIRAERRAKAAELRSFLRSGQGALASFDGALMRRHADVTARVVVVPFAPERGTARPARDSAARSALKRAVAHGNRSFRSEPTIPLSAG